MPCRETDKAHAPWTAEQVNSLNAYQNDSRLHEFTGPMGGRLLATPEGWVEPPSASVVQTWAWCWMADWGWQNMVGR